MKTLFLFILLNTDTSWCPPVYHNHTKHFRYSGWTKKNEIWIRIRKCTYKKCSYYALKQYKYRQ